MLKILKWVLVPLVAYGALYMYAGYSYMQKGAICMTPQLTQAISAAKTKAQALPLLEELTRCTSSKSNWLERHFFPEEKMLALIRDPKTSFKRTL